MGYDVGILLAVKNVRDALRDPPHLWKGLLLATEANRIEGFDMFRAIAILAMVMVNFASIMGGQYQ